MSEEPKPKKLKSGAEGRRRKKAKGEWTEADKVRISAVNQRHHIKRKSALALTGTTTRKRKRKRTPSLLINKAKTLVDEMKLSKGCADCGYKGHPVALQFDHMPGHKKVLNIARMTGRHMTWDKISREIEKCEIVCANCHAIRTFNRGQHGKMLPPDSFPLFPGFHPLFDKIPHEE